MGYFWQLRTYDAGRTWEITSSYDARRRWDTFVPSSLEVLKDELPLLVVGEAVRLEDVRGEEGLEVLDANLSGPVAEILLRHLNQLHIARGIPAVLRSVVDANLY